jgi:hypothetical protein
MCSLFLFVISENEEIERFGEKELYKEGSQIVSCLCFIFLAIQSFIKDIFACYHFSLII